jgi:hypothetical protein
LNIVKIRYMDLPVFVDVASIVAGYSLQTGVSITGTSSAPKAVQGDFVTGNAQALYTDRPTITYVPLTGEKFLRGLITPIDPKNIFFMLQAGYAADFILGLTVESLNGVRNRSAAGGAVREADPEFIEALDLLRQIQAAGGVGMRVEEDKAKGATAVLFFQREDATPEVREKAKEIRRLLRLSLDENKFVLTYSPMRGGPGELAVNSRSMLQIMAAFASYMDLPEEDLREKRAVPAFEKLPPSKRQDPVKIHCTNQRPTRAFAEVHYRGRWFWIDDGDWQSKRAMTAVMFFFSLAEGATDEKLPLITIPAQ